MGSPATSSATIGIVSANVRNHHRLWSTGSGRPRARLLGAVEHEAWTGTSWRVKRTVFVHVVQIAEGWPPAYANAFDTPGPATVVTFQADPDEYHALTQGPFHAPPWRPGIIGTIIGPNTDWVELAELITESHCVCR